MAVLVQQENKELFNCIDASKYLEYNLRDFMLILNRGLICYTMQGATRMISKKELDRYKLEVINAK
jgi:hypothetical protein